ncbi:MAG: XapX domain-containing protein [Telmatospirillum sp.]|nr:XapX domain-containing protein [Telmatospirillum sp.]
MKMAFLSLAAGILVGVIYALLGVRSPAPPVVALVGLLGMLIGEQIPPVVKAAFQRAESPAETRIPGPAGPADGDPPAGPSAGPSSVPSFGPPPPRTKPRDVTGELS